MAISGRLLQACWCQRMASLKVGSAGTGPFNVAHPFPGVRHLADRKTAVGQVPKKPISAFFYYLRDFRHQHPNYTCTEASKRGGQAWKQMPDEAKQPYFQEALQSKKEYEAEIASLSKTVVDDIRKMKVERMTEKALRKAKSAKKKLEDDLNKPKAPPNAYVLFLKDQSKKIKERDPTANMRHIVKEVGIEWKSLDEATRRMYEERAAEMLKEYKSEKLAWDEKMRASQEIQEIDEVNAKVKGLKKKMLGIANHGEAKM